MYDSKLKVTDNKLRLSADIISKAEEIAQAWGLKNSRAAIEAVFRKYADDYLYGRQPAPLIHPHMLEQHNSAPTTQSKPQKTTCEALDELDALLGI
jgi:hypothetical protein